MNTLQIVPKSENIPHYLTHETDLIKAFLRGRNYRTIDAYERDLQDFRAFLGAKSIDDASKILLSRGPGEANALALAYKTHLIERGLQAATVNRRLAALRSLVKLARTLGLVSWALEVENIKMTPYRDTRGPGRIAFKAMVSEVSSEKRNKAARGKAILRLLFDLGLRRGEVAALDLADLDLNASCVAVMGKGRSEKVNLTLPDPTRAALIEWLSVRGITPGPLFCNFDHAGKGDRLTGTSIYRIVRSLGERLGVKVRPHGIRHSAITEALTATGGDIRATARFSRHKNVQTVLIYDDNRQDIGGEVSKLVAALV